MRSRSFPRPDARLMAHAETCPQYFLLDVDRYDEPGFEGAKDVLTPPLREKWNHDELSGGLRTYTLDVIFPTAITARSAQGAEGAGPQLLQQNS